MTLRGGNPVSRRWRGWQKAADVVCKAGKASDEELPYSMCGGSVFCILFQLFRSRPFTDGTRGVSNTFRDQHVLAPEAQTDLERQLMHQQL